MPKNSGSLRLAFALAFALICVVCLGPRLSAQFPVSAQAGATANTGPQPVIVFLKHQPPVEKVGSGAETRRGVAIENEQQPLLDEIRAANATHIKSFKLVNAFAATIPPAEIDKLKANPAVASVIPDHVIKRKQPSADQLKKSATAKTANPAHSNSMQLHANTSAVNTIPGACSTNPGAPLLVPEGLALTNTDSMNGGQTAHSLGVNGAGIKVAFLADGIDTSNPNFIRPDGKSVFDSSIGGDYQDFTGEGPDAPTSGDEAFLDANTIAGQGIQVYDVSPWGEQPNSPHCYVQIEGVAPGAALVGLRVADQSGNLTTSAIVQAIDYAVEVDHVDIINESFGANNYPDTALDATRQFDEAAVAAGVFVTVGTGDAGMPNTLQSPASDPMVMSVGASTQFQMYIQSNEDFASYFATNGWLSNNISALSSGGYDLAGTTIDMVAPGDLSWASCDANSNYVGCTAPTGQLLDFESAGGTSESSPFVGGAAALVIQAYRLAHSGQDPTPALVKQILLSSASDLGAPAVEQGAGLLNSYQAVLLAESVDSPNPMGNTLLLSTSQLNAVDKPGTAEDWVVRVTNTGATKQTISVSGRTLGPDQNVQTGSVTLNTSTDPQLPFVSGVEEEYQTFQFNVPAGAARLDAALSYQGNFEFDAHLILIDSQGRFAASSLPQGVANYAEVDVLAPVAGVWTGVVFAPILGGQGLNETIPWRVATEQYAPFANIGVWNSKLTIAPGETEPIVIRATTPANPGDADGAIVLTSNLGQSTTIPVTLRSLIDVSAGGAFSANLTGGNGREYPLGQNLYYQFHVGPGVQSIAANVTLGNDPNYLLGSYLVSPDGDTLGYGANQQGSSSMSAHTWNMAGNAQGRWTLIVNNQLPDGAEVSQPITGNIAFNNSNVTVSAPGLPNSEAIHLAPGVQVTIPVTITNNGPAVGNFFVDGRLTQKTAMLIPDLVYYYPFPISLPLPDGQFPLWVVPSETEAIAMIQESSVPIMFDTQPYAGDPDILSTYSSACSTASGVIYTPLGGQVTPGYWYAIPAECGPFSTSAVSGEAEMELAGLTAGFDPNILADTGDFWAYYALQPEGSNGFSPITLGTGQSATFNVYITPVGAPTSTVKGTLFIDDFIQGVPPSHVPAASEVIAIPYEYRIQ